MGACNHTIQDHGDELVSKEEPLWHGFTFHHFGLILTATFGMIAVLVALFLIIQHARHYSKPWEQRHIIRILLMIPVYAIVSFFSYLFFHYAVYWEVIRDCYEAFAIASFFTLLCHYLEPTLHEQKNFFRQMTPKNWVWPVPWLQRCTGGQSRGLFRIPRSGLTWFNIIWFGVFQYCAVRVLCTFAALISQFFGRYCESSLSPEFGHIWIMTIEGLAVTGAMYCLVQFYIQLKGDLAEHRPFMKVLCIKLVIFFSFWQSLLISFLSSANGPLKPTKKVAYPDIKIGIPSLLLCIEMAVFAVLHLWAFRYSVYDIRKNPALQTDPATARYRGFGHALLDAFNPWDIVKALARGFRWMFVGYRRREQDESYKMAPGGKAMMMDGPLGPPVEMGKPLGGGGNGGGNGQEDTAGLLGNAQFDPHAHTGYKGAGAARATGNPSQQYGGDGNVYDPADLGLTSSLARDYDAYLASGNGSYPPPGGMHGNGSAVSLGYPPSYGGSGDGGAGVGGGMSRQHSDYGHGYGYEGARPVEGAGPLDGAADGHDRQQGRPDGRGGWGGPPGQAW